MVISHNKKFIFIHNFKAAGTSMRKSLFSVNNVTFGGSSRIDKLKFLTGIYPRIFSNQFRKHSHAIDIKNLLPAKVFDQYYKFGFVRNPWDMQVSLYTFTLKRTTHPDHERVKKMKDFSEFLDWKMNSDFRLQKHFFYNGDTCLMDYIGRFENLNEDFTQICNHLGFESELVQLNVSRKKTTDFTTFYTEETLDLVAEAYKEDIEAFGYARPVLKISEPLLEA